MLDFRKETERKETEGGKMYFGELQLFAVPCVYQKGAEFIIPGITAGKFDRSKNGDKIFENYKVGSIDSVGGPGYRFIMALKCHSVEGDVYFRLRQYNSWQNREGINEWLKYALPGMEQKLGQKKLDSMLLEYVDFYITGETAFVQVEALSSDVVYNNTAKLYWNIIAIFSDKRELDEAANLFFQVDEPAVRRYADLNLMIPDGDIWNEQKWLEGGVTMIKMQIGLGLDAVSIATLLQVDTKYVDDVIDKMELRTPVKNESKEEVPF